jgi:hypothetical protein
MFKISKAQLASFQDAALATFEAAMVARGTAVAPRLATSLGPDGMLVVVRAAIARAARHGLTFKGPVGLFVELSFLLGSGFDADVQYPWARRCLAGVRERGQMAAASALHAASGRALRRIHGPNNRHTDEALRLLPALVAEPRELHAYDFAAVVLATMKLIHPRKCAFVGTPALLALIAAGEAEAARQGFVALPDVLLVVGLLFAFGAQCTDDPLYPWISGTLRSPTIVTPALRARELEKTALIWLQQVVVKRENSV